MLAWAPSPVRSTSAALVAVCASWLAVGSARAQVIPEETPRAVLIVHPEGAPAEAAASRLYSQLSETLATSTQFQAVPLVDLVGSSEEQSSVPTGVRKRFNRARKAYDNLELERAVKLLRGVAAALEANLVAGLDLELYTEVLVYLGASKILLGDKKAGREIFRKLVGINPAAQINPIIFPPSLVTAFSEEGQKLSKAPPGSLDLRSKPAGSAIWIDGRERGSTPQSLTGLPPGAHAVRLVRLGYQSAASMVSVPEAGQATFAPTLIALAGAERLRFLASRLKTAVAKERYPSTVDEALRWAKADRLFFLVVQALPATIQIEAYHFDGLASERLRARRIELSSQAGDLDDRVQAFFKGLYMEQIPDLPSDLAWLDLDPDPALAGHVDPLPDQGGEEPGDGDGVWTSWWLWTVVGVVVVGGAGIALGLTLGTDQQANAGDVVFRF